MDASLAMLLLFWRVAQTLPTHLYFAWFIGPPEELVYL